MDPNETLRRIREVFKNFDDTKVVDYDEISELFCEAETLFESLDEWLSKGGFLPEAWKKCK